VLHRRRSLQVGERGRRAGHQLVAGRDRRGARQVAVGAGGGHGGQPGHLARGVRVPGRRGVGVVVVVNRGVVSVVVVPGRRVVVVVVVVNRGVVGVVVVPGRRVVLVVVVVNRGVVSVVVVRGRRLAVEGRGQAGDVGLLVRVLLR